MRADVRRGFCRSSEGTTSALHLCGLGAGSGRGILSEQIESQDDVDLRLMDEVIEPTEACDDRSDHPEADDAAVDCEVDREGAYWTCCQEVG